MKNIIRTCIACRKKSVKEDFFRITNNSGKIIIDESYKLCGRSAYICRDARCVDLVSKKKCLGYALKMNINPEEHLHIIDVLREKINNLH